MDTRLRWAGVHKSVLSVHSVYIWPVISISWHESWDVGLLQKLCVLRRWNRSEQFRVLRFMSRYRLRGIHYYSFMITAHGRSNNSDRTVHWTRNEYTILNLLNPRISLPFSNLSTGLRSTNGVERIEYKLFSLTYKVLTTSQPSYLNNLISVQPPRSTRSSSVVTLSRPHQPSPHWKS